MSGREGRGYEALLRENRYIRARLEERAEACATLRRERDEARAELGRVRQLIVDHAHLCAIARCQCGLEDMGLAIERERA